MKCPLVNTKEWKELVDKYGELEAFAIYSRNGFEMKPLSDIGDVSFTERELDDAQTLKKITEVRSNILNALKTKFSVYSNINPAKKEKMATLIKSFNDNGVELTLRRFIVNAENTIKYINKRVGAEDFKKLGEKDKFELLNRLNSYAGVYELVDDVLEIFNNIPDSKKYADSNIKRRLKGIYQSYKEFRSVYMSEAKSSLSEAFALRSTKAISEFRIKTASEYERNNPKKQSPLSEAEYKEAKQKYVDNEVANNADMLYARDRRMLKDIMEQAPSDISSLTRMIVDPRGINDTMIQLVVKLLDDADFRAKTEFAEQRLGLINLFEKYKKGKTSIITNQKKLYDGLIEKRKNENGELVETNYYVREVYNEVYSEFAKARKEFFAKKDAGVPIAEITELKDFYKKYTKNSKKYDYNERTKKFKNFMIYDEVNKESKIDFDNIKDEYKNPQFKQLSGEKKELYDALIKFNKESDSMVSGSGKLGYRLPSILSKDSELITNDGVLKGTKKKIKRSYGFTIEDEEELGVLAEKDGKLRVATDQSGKPLRTVALPYRRDLEIKDQSFDLVGMSLANRQVSLNYKHKSNLQNMLEVTLDVMGERTLEKRSGGKSIYRSAKSILHIEDDEITDVKDTMPGIKSESYKLLESIMDDRLYGKHSIYSRVGSISLNKLSSNLIKAASHNMLIANLMAGQSNLLNGKIMNFFEGTKKTLYSGKDLRSAEVYYGKEFASGKIVSDWENLSPQSVTNLLLERFYDPEISFNNVSDMTNDSKLKRAFNMSTLHGINSAVEHYIQGTLMYATLNNIKAKNKFGKYVDKEGFEVESRDKAASVIDFYKNVDGKLTWTDYNITAEGFKSMDFNAERSIAFKLREVAKELQGNYDPTNQSMIQRYWYGQQLFFMRKWIVPGFTRRWRGADTVFKKQHRYWDELESHEKFYSESSQEFKEGSYVSLIRYMRGVFKNVKNLEVGIIASEWDKMNDMEQANIKSAIWELGIMTAAFTASAMLFGLASDNPDEEEKELIFKYAYLTRRVYGDLQAFTPMGITGEGLRTAKSPTVSLAYVDLCAKTLNQLFKDMLGGEFELYKSGDNRGESKSYINLRKMFDPIYKNYSSRDYEVSLNYLKQGAK